MSVPQAGGRAGGRSPGPEGADSPRACGVRSGGRGGRPGRCPVLSAAGAKGLVVGRVWGVEAAFRRSDRSPSSASWAGGLVAEHPWWGTLTALSPFQGELAPTPFQVMTRWHRLSPLELGAEPEQVEVVGSVAAEVLGPSSHFHRPLSPPPLDLDVGEGTPILTPFPPLSPYLGQRPRVLVRRSLPLRAPNRQKVPAFCSTLRSCST